MKSLLNHPRMTLTFVLPVRFLIFFNVSEFHYLDPGDRYEAAHTGHGTRCPLYLPHAVFFHYDIITLSFIQLLQRTRQSQRCGYMAATKN